MSEDTRPIGDQDLKEVAGGKGEEPIAYGGDTKTPVKDDDLGLVAGGKGTPVAAGDDGKSLISDDDLANVAGGTAPTAGGDGGDDRGDIKVKVDDQNFI